MKTMIAIAVIVIALVGFFSLGCAAKGGSFGQTISETNITLIKDILSNPEQFHGKTVRVEGKITDECPSGGWFFLKDSTGLIYVNLHPSYFAIPQAVGRSATAQGTVRKEGPQVEIIGKGVQLE